MSTALTSPRAHALVFALAAAATCSCGSRTPLDFAGQPLSAGAGASEPDGASLSDGSLADGEVVTEAGTPVPPPPPCTDAAESNIYVVGQSGKLYAFNPHIGTPYYGLFTAIGKLHCPHSFVGGGPPLEPWSIAVDRQAVAYLDYSDDGVFVVDTTNATCSAPGFGNAALPSHTMAFAGSAAGSAESLYVLDPSSQLLSTVDTTSFRTMPVGNVSIPDGGSVEQLTGTADGRLFVLTSTSGVYGWGIAELDPTTAAVRTTHRLPSSLFELKNWTATPYTIAFYAGAFFVFTGPGRYGGTTFVHRFVPGDGTAKPAGIIHDTIVAAGASTCAPLR